jgi:hypothetical protein
VPPILPAEPDARPSRFTGGCLEAGMVRLAASLVCAALMSMAAHAQGSQLDHACSLLSAGHPEAALDILETLPETPVALRGRAQAHLMIASQVAPGLACDHLRRAMDLGSMASAGGIVEFARRRFSDDGCQIAQPGW